MATRETKARALQVQGQPEQRRDPVSEKLGAVPALHTEAWVPFLASPQDRRRGKERFCPVYKKMNLPPSLRD